MNAYKTEDLKQKLLELQATRTEMESKNDYADLVENLEFNLLVAQINWVGDRIEKIEYDKPCTLKWEI